MASNLNSFDQSPAGAFLESPLGARGAGGSVIGRRILDWAGPDVARPHVRWFVGLPNADTELNWSGRLSDYGLILRAFPISNPSWWSQFLDGWAGDMVVPAISLQALGGSVGGTFCGTVSPIAGVEIYQPSVGYVNALPSGLSWNSSLIEGPLDYVVSDALPGEIGWHANCNGVAHNMRPGRARYAANATFWGESGDTVVALGGARLFCRIGGGGLLIGVSDWLNVFATASQGLGGAPIYVSASSEPLAAVASNSGVTWVMANLDLQVFGRVLSACIQRLPAP